jgi:hypothetical protein
LSRASPKKPSISPDTIQGMIFSKVKDSAVKRRRASSRR